jgi:hypothetical protein
MCIVGSISLKLRDLTTIKGPIGDDSYIPVDNEFITRFIRGSLSRLCERRGIVISQSSRSISTAKIRLRF